MFYNHRDWFLSVLIGLGFALSIGLLGLIFFTQTINATVVALFACGTTFIAVSLIFLIRLWQMAKQTQITLEALTKERKEIEKTKSEFISVISHELRTPLTSIHGALGLLCAEKTFSKKVSVLLDLAYRNSERLSHILNDLLDIEYLDLGKLRMDLKSILLADVIKESVRSSQGIANKAHISIETQLLSEPITVLADYGRLIQVMLNLLSNAIKFSPPHKTVFVSMALESTYVVVYVKNDGHGIAEDFQEKLFRKFSTESSNQKSGSGLGLSICKSIIRELNGEVGFMSKKNEGATFYFKLPVVRHEH